MSNKKILISGAGVGGLTVAYFLKQKGFDPVIIEKASSLRDGGYMIDFFSSGISVSEKMGIIDQLKVKDHHSNIIIQQNEKGKKQFILNMSGFRESVKGKLFNFLRTDLVDVLYKKVKENEKASCIIQHCYRNGTQYPGSKCTNKEKRKSWCKGCSYRSRSGSGSRSRSKS